MPKNTEYKEEIKKKFLCQDKFAQEIESIVQSDTAHTYISAIVEYCEENNIEIENISKLITKPLKEKLRYEAIELNFIKRTSKAKLPF